MRSSMEKITTIDLGHDQMLVFDGGRSGRMRVLFGATWLTQEGETQDTILYAGGELPFGGARTVIEGLGQTRVQIAEDTAHGLPPAWLRQAWRGLRQGIKRLQLGSGAVRPLREFRQPWLNGPLSARHCESGATGKC